MGLMEVKINKLKLIDECNIDRTLELALYDDNFYADLINSEAFRRLKSVSFLGAIDHTHSNSSIKSDRYQHSIDVAKLALFISKKRNYDIDTEHHLVAAALLHDIGHAPLSHSMESSFENEYGIDHHIATESVIKGKEYSNNLYIRHLLDKNVNLDSVLDLINQNSNEEFSDIFSSPINIDTIDGIYKSLKYIRTDCLFDKYTTALSSLDYHKDSVTILSNFWGNKNLVYNKLITSGIGAIADQISKEYFYDNKNKLDESYFYKKEDSLFKGRAPIFKEFKNKLKQIKISNNDFGTDELNFDIIKREYSIDKSFPIEDDYSNLNEMKKIFKCNKNKEKASIKYSFNNGSKVKQYKLF